MCPTPKQETAPFSVDYSIQDGRLYGPGIRKRGIIAGGRTHRQLVAQGVLDVSFIGKFSRNGRIFSLSACANI